MPHIATSCCVMKASLCRDRSCILCYPFFAWCHAKQKKALRTFDIRFRMDHAIIFKGRSTPFTRQLRGVTQLHQKGQGFILGGFKHRVAASLVLLMSTRPALSLLKSLPGFFVGRIPRTGFAGYCGRPS